MGHFWSRLQPRRTSCPNINTKYVKYLAAGNTGFRWNLTITFLINRLIKPVTKIGRIRETPRASWWLTSLLWVFKSWLHQEIHLHFRNKQSWPNKPGLNNRAFLCFAAGINTRVCCHLVHKANDPPRLQQPHTYLQRWRVWWAPAPAPVW